MTPPVRAALATAILIAAGPVPGAAEPLRPWCGAGPLNAAERTVCGTPELARLDARLAAAYGALRSADPAQDAWLRGRRDGCGGDVTCLRAAYAERLRQLGARDGG